MLVPVISDVRREAIATPAASSAAPLIRLPVERRSIESSISLFTLDAAAWAIKAPVLVALQRELRNPFLYKLIHIFETLQRQV
jgi:hypothetical protein